MAKPHDDDLFKDSVMTFGEHLDELRRCLWKAVLGLFVGFLIGLYFADWVVNVVQKPLVDALEQYYLEINRDEYKKINPNFTDKDLEMIEDRRMVFRREFIQPERVVEELRKTYPKALEGIEPAPKTAGTGSSNNFAEKLMEIEVWTPIENDPRTRTKSLGMPEPFMIWLKAAFITGLIVSSPWVFYQIWSFVAAGLYPHEKKYVHVFMPFSIGLFLAGAAVAFFFVFEPVLDFFLNFNRSLKIDSEPRISEWLNFFMFLPVGFGIAFQLPLVMLFLERIHVMSVTTYLKQWRVAVLVIWVVAALLTPADPTSIFFLAVPLMFLYFGGVLLCKWWPSGKK